MTKRTRIDLEQEPIDPSFRMHNPGRMREVREQIRYNDLAEQALDIVNRNDAARTHLRDEAHRQGMRTYSTVVRHLEGMRRDLGRPNRNYLDRLRSMDLDYAFEFRHPEEREIGRALRNISNELIDTPEAAYNFVSLGGSSSASGTGLVRRAMRDGRYTGTYTRWMLPAGWRLFERRPYGSLHAREVGPPPE